MKFFSKSFMALAAATLLFTACNNASAFRTDANTYLRANISSLSPRAAELGGTFRVSKVEWEDEDTALVTYDDGHNEFTGRVDVRSTNNRIVTSNFRIQSGNNSSSMSMSSMSMSNSSMSNGQMSSGMSQSSAVSTGSSASSGTISSMVSSIMGNSSSSMNTSSAMMNSSSVMNTSSAMMNSPSR